MTTKELRELFITEALPHAILDDPTAFYDAFSEGEAEVTAFLTAVWETLCVSHGDTLAAHPFFPDVAFWLVDETEENFTCMMDVYLPASGACAAYYQALVFGAAMDPRYFGGTPKGNAVAVIEWTMTGDTLTATACGLLDADISEDERRERFMEQVYAVCDAYSAEN